MRELGRYSAAFPTVHAVALGRMSWLAVPTVPGSMLTSSALGVAGKIFCGVVAVDYLYWRWLEWWRPRTGIESAPTLQGKFKEG